MPLHSINKDQGVYVLSCGAGFSCLGFEVAFDRTAAMAAEIGRDDLKPVASMKATTEGYAQYERALDAAREYHKRTGKRLTCELTPQLRGLEGRRVEITDRYGDTRRFVVGRSTGFIPIHLEIAGRHSDGGPSVTGAPFQSLRVLGSRPAAHYSPL